MKLTIFHILFIIITLKLIQMIFDPIFLLICIIAVIGIYYGYLNNYIEFELPIGINKNNEFEVLKSNLLNKFNSFKFFNNELKLNIQKKIIEYNNNASFIFYEMSENCTLYFDVLYNQRTDLINLIKSTILTLPNLKNYNFFKRFSNKIHDDIDNIFEFVKKNKCPEYEINAFMPRNVYNYKNSYNQV